MHTTYRLQRAAFALFVSLLICGLAKQPAVVGAEPRETYFPKISLETQDKNKVEVYKDLFSGRIVVVNFFYTQCTGERCVAGMANLLRLQNALGDRLGTDVYMYSITLDPEHDTADVLKAYAKEHGIKQGWVLLTGKLDDITSLRRKLGLFNSNSDKDADLKQHTGMIVIGNVPLDKWSQTSITTTPDHILEMIERMKPPPAAQK
jgi:protein SCO1/2